MQESGFYLPPVYSCLLIYRGVTHPGRTVTARERGVCRGASASRSGQTSGRRRQEQESGSPADCPAPAPASFDLRPAFPASVF